MGKVCWHVTTSLDGYIAGPGHATDWISDYWEAENATAQEAAARTGALVVGRRAHELARERPGLHGEPWSGPLLVLDDEPVADVVARARDAAGGRDVGVLGGEVARECLDARLLERVVVHVAPILLGDGERMLDVVGCAPVRLRPTHLARSGSLTDLRFDVVDTDSALAYADLFAVHQLMWDGGRAIAA